MWYLLWVLYLVSPTVVWRAKFATSSRLSVPAPLTAPLALPPPPAAPDCARGWIPRSSMLSWRRQYRPVLAVALGRGGHFRGRRRRVVRDIGGEERKQTRTSRARGAVYPTSICEDCGPGLADRDTGERRKGCAHQPIGFAVFRVSTTPLSIFKY
ncbi:unnamed protein product, partial [Ectocarpus sp. 12 AP-2014]